METAYHCQSNRHLTIKGFKDNYGPKLDKLGQKRMRPELVCYACLHPMHTVGEDLPGRDWHWGHNPSSNAPWCPLKEPAGRPYQLLAPGTDISIAEGEVMKQQVLAHWRQHWAHIQELAPMADIHTFIGFLQWANRTQLWRHRGLQEWFIPYICLSTCDFPPSKNPKALAKRPEWLRFWFDSRVRTIEDLWIHTNGDFRIMRALYHAPTRGGQPSASQLIRIEPIQPDPTFLARPVRVPAHEYQVSKMQEIFGVH